MMHCFPPWGNTECKAAATIWKTTVTSTAFPVPARVTLCAPRCSGDLSQVKAVKLLLAHPDTGPPNT